MVIEPDVMKNIFALMVIRMRMGLKREFAASNLLIIQVVRKNTCAPEKICIRIGAAKNIYVVMRQLFVSAFKRRKENIFLEEEVEIKVEGKIVVVVEDVTEDSMEEEAEDSIEDKAARIIAAE